MPNSIIAFAQEKVAMIFAPSWQVLTIKTINPELKLKVVPVPSVPGSSPVSLASYWVEGVSRYSKNQTEAWKFIRYLVEKDTLTKLHAIHMRRRVDFAQVPVHRNRRACTLILKPHRKYNLKRIAPPHMLFD